MSTPVGSVTVPLSVVDPNEFTLRQPLGIGGYAGGDELQLWMDQTGTLVYLEVDDATMFVLNLADVAVAVLEAIPRIEKEAEGPQPTWPLKLISESDERIFPDLSALTEAINEGWLIDSEWDSGCDSDGRYWMVDLKLKDDRGEPLESITFEPRGTASQAKVSEEPEVDWPVELISTGPNIVCADRTDIADAIDEHPLETAGGDGGSVRVVVDGKDQTWHVKTTRDPDGQIGTVTLKTWDSFVASEPTTSHGS